jgi:hypothetical protein
MTGCFGETRCICTGGFAVSGLALVFESSRRRGLRVMQATVGEPDGILRRTAFRRRDKTIDQMVS